MSVELPKNILQRQNRRGNIIVVEDEPDQWMLIEAASRQAMPDIEVVWSKTTQNALAHLTNCVNAGQPLPRLMLLDLFIPSTEAAWQLLQAIRQPESPFLWMPVVLITNSDYQANINHFYNFGGTSYIIKPNTYEQWVDYLRTLRQYWWETVTLPGGR